MPKYEYKTLPETTVEELERIERLVARGWKIVKSRMFSVVLEKQIKPRGKQ